jgi:hypothetical protein
LKAAVEVKSDPRCEFVDGDENSDALKLTATLTQDRERCWRGIQASVATSSN